MASFASSATTGGARKHTWTNKKGMEENVILFYTNTAKGGAQKLLKTN